MANVNQYAERAKYILQCAEKERDELQYRIDKSAPNDALRMNGESMLKGFGEKISAAKRNAIEAGAVFDKPLPSANLNAIETDRILRLPRK